MIAQRLDRAGEASRQDNLGRDALRAALAEAQRLHAHVRGGGVAVAIVSSAADFTRQLKTLHPDRHPGATTQQKDALDAAVNVVIAARNATLKGDPSGYAALLAKHAPAPAAPRQRTMTSPLRQGAGSPPIDVFEDMFGPLGGYGRATRNVADHSPSNRAGSRGSGWASLVRGWSRS